MYSCFVITVRKRDDDFGAGPPKNLAFAPPFSSVNVLEGICGTFVHTVTAARKDGRKSFFPFY